MRAARVNVQSETIGAGANAQAITNALANLASLITYNANVTLFQTRPALRRIVQTAIDRTIREVIQSPVVERSVTIAVIATRELATKDFALEPNEARLRSSAQAMAQSLAGSLAAVSSREPIRVSMLTNLKALLLQNGFTEVYFYYLANASRAAYLRCGSG